MASKTLALLWAYADSAVKASAPPANEDRLLTEGLLQLPEVRRPHGSIKDDSAEEDATRSRHAAVLQYLTNAIHQVHPRCNRCQPARQWC